MSSSASNSSADALLILAAGLLHQPTEIEFFHDPVQVVLHRSRPLRVDVAELGHRSLRYSAQSGVVCSKQGVEQDLDEVEVFLAVGPQTRSA